MTFRFKINNLKQLQLKKAFIIFMLSFVLINADSHSFNYLSEVNVKSKDYWLFTSYVDRCIIRDHLGERMVEESKMNQTFFTVKYDESYPSYVRLENDRCDENPTLMICTSNKKECTRKIHLEYGKEISLDSCFIKYPSTIIYNLQNHYLWFKSVLDKVMGSKIACDKGAVLKGGKSPKLSDGHRLVFSQADHSYFVDWMDFDINFSTLPNNQIESMYIIEHNSKDDLVLCAGDVSDMKDVYNFSDLFIFKIDMVIEELEVQDTIVKYRFRHSVLKTMAFKELIKGKWYEMDVKLKNDPIYYVLNFQFLPDVDIEYLRSFEADE